MMRLLTPDECWAIDNALCEDNAYLAMDENDGFLYREAKFCQAQAVITQEDTLKAVGQKLNEIMQTAGRGKRIGAMEKAIADLLCGKWPE